MNTADQVVRFFEFSPKKQHRLEENIDEGFSKSKLKELCRTRWVERYYSFSVFLDVLPAIVATLEEFRHERNTRSAGAADPQSLLNSVRSCQFIVCLVIVHQCLGYLHGLCRSLQERSLDVSKAMEKVSIVTATIRECRVEVETTHDTWFKKAEDICRNLSVDIRLPRTCARQTTRDNTPAVEPQEYYRKTLTIPFLDHLQTELSSRFTELQNRAIEGLKLVPTAMTSRSVFPLA